MANASYYNNSARKKDHEKKMQEALEARKKRSSSSSESSFAEKKKAHDQKLQAALDARSERIQVSLPDVMADIQRQIAVEIDSYNRNTKKPAFGAFEETFKNQSDRRRGISELRSKVEAYRSYMEDGVADSIISTLDQMKSGYDAHLSMSQFSSQEEFDSAVRQYGYRQKYSGKSYEDIQSSLDNLEDGEEKDWLSKYQYEAVKTSADYDSRSTAGWEKYLADQENKRKAQEDARKNESWMDKVGRWLGPNGAVDTSIPLGNVPEITHTLSADTSYLRPNQNWTDEQKGVYGYLYDADKTAAGIYAQNTTERNNQEENAEKIAAIEAWATKNGWTGSVATLGAIAMMPLSLTDTLSALTEYNARGFVSTSATPLPGQVSNAITGAISTELNKKSGTISAKIPVIGGKGLGDAYQLGTSIANSMISAYTQGSIGTYMVFFGSASSSAMYDAKNRGASDEQAITLGILSGLAEAAGEAFSVEHLLGLGGKELSGFFFDVLMQAGVEASEEGVTTLLNNFSEQLVMGDKSNFNVLVNYYMTEKGLSESEAKKKAWLDMANDLAFDMFGGAISGGVSAGLQTGVQTMFVNHVENERAQQIYGSDPGALVNEALEIDPDNAFAQKMQGRLDSGKNLSGGQLNRLVKQNEAALNAQDVSNIQSAAESRLTELGETGNVTAIAAALTKQAAGENLSRAEQQLISSSKYGQRVANELNTENINSGGYASAWAENIGTERINAQEYSRLVEAAQLPQETAEVTGDQVATETPKAAQVAQAEPVEAPTATADKNATVEHQPETTAANDQQVTGKLIGKEALQVAEESSAAKEPKEKTVTLEKASEKYGAQAQAMIHTYVSGQDVVKYDQGYQAAYDMGKSGVAFSYLEKSPAVSYLTDSQKQLAYEAGQAASNTAAQELDARNKAAANGKTGRKKGVVRGEGVTISDLKQTFNDTQGKAYKYLSTVAEVTGIDIVLYRSEAGPDGKFQGAQGRYRRSEPGTIYIDLNAGLSDIKSVDDLAKYAMLRTFAHEFTHFLENLNPIQYNELRKVVFDTLTERGENVHDLIEDKQARTPGMSYDNASREVVAEAMTDILPDANFVQELAEKHQTVFQKLLEKLKEFVANLREYFDSIGHNRSREANALKEQVGDTIKYLDSIVQLFDRVAIQAVENYQKTVATEEVVVAKTETTTTASETKVETNTQEVETKVEEAAPVVEKDAYGFTISDNVEHGSLEITFDSKPSDEVRNVLKENKFRWHKVKKVWFGFTDRQTITDALHAAYKAEETASAAAPEQSDFEKSFWNATQAERDEVVNAIHENTKISHMKPSEVRGGEHIDRKKEVNDNGITENGTDTPAVYEPVRGSEGPARLLEGVEPETVPGSNEGRQPVQSGSDQGAGDAGRDGRANLPAEDAAEPGTRDRVGGDLQQLPAVTKSVTDTNVGDKSVEETKPGSTDPVKLHEIVVDLTAQRSTENPKGSNFVIGDSLNLPNGTKARTRANIDAIKLVKQIAAEGRIATAAEQEILSKYVGWGGLADAFGKPVSNYATRKIEYEAVKGLEEEFEELKTVLTEEEYKSARESTKNAHYTSIEVIKAMYDGLKHLGFTGGRMLEPSSGVGNFVGAMPADMTAQVKSWTMVELDNITGLFAKYLYPNADVRIQGFEEANIPDGYMDVAIGNVPFGKYAVTDKHYPKTITSAIHNYFFAKSLDKVRTGGIVMFITSAYTMNSRENAVRKYIMQRADLLGAIRLPNTAFAGNAGTSVVTDILILKKRADRTEYAGEAFETSDWERIGTSGYYDGAYINEYFVQHPEMVLGTPKLTRGMYSANELTYDPFTDKGSLGDQIRSAMQNIQGKMDYSAQLSAERENFRQASAKKKSQKLQVKDGVIHARDENGNLTKVDVDKDTAARITGMVAIRDAHVALCDALQQGVNKKEANALRKALNKAYDSFVEKYGYLNSNKNKRAINAFADRYAILSLENYRTEGKKIVAEKSDIFTKDTIAANRTASSAENVDEGLTISLNTVGRVDVPMIARLTGQKAESVTRQLIDQRLVFKDRDGNLIPAVQYLSGNVRAKLREMEGLVGIDSDYQNNVEALGEVVPPAVQHTDIYVNPGANWVPTEVYEDFVGHVLNRSNHVSYRNGKKDFSVEYVPETNEYKVVINDAYAKMSAQNTQVWAEGGKAFSTIFENMLNGRRTNVYRDNGDGTRVLDKAKTEAVAEKVEKLNEEFRKWLWEDESRRTEMQDLYNETYNALVTPKYSGESLTVNGLNATYELRPHQKDAVARIINSGGNTLLAHRVGAGKTMEMAAAAMKLKQLGVIKKPMFVVPNNVVAQWGKEFKDYFPAANILVVGDEDMTPAERMTTINKIKNNDYDAVILAYTKFEKIQMTTAWRQKFYEEQIDSIMFAINAEKESQGGKGFSVKQLEQKRKQLEAKLKKLTEKVKDEDGAMFEDLGVDALFVDEAHNFKNLEYSTRMNNVSGLGKADGSQRAFDLYTKVRYLQQLNGGRGVVFATATPVMNSMTEMYIMQKYLQPDTLKQLGIEHFDSWAKMFGEVVNALEIAPSGSGYRLKQTFSKFKNVKALQQLFRSFTDVLTDVPGLKIPKMKGRKVQIVECEQGEFQKNYMAELAERAENVKNVDPSEDNMLKITSDGRKISYSQRMIDPSLPYEETGKIYRCCENVYDVYWESNATKGTQMIFCDMATPKGKSNSKTETDTNTDEFASVDVESAQLYDDMKSRLVQLGIPEKEIAFIHDAKNDKQKAELSEKMNNGTIRVLIGSTGKMGVGLNAQKKAVAIHHLDAPWRPGDIEQRDGRVFRQKNQNEEAYKFVYVTRGSFDSRLWDILERKQKFINQVMNGEDVGNEIEDTGEVTLSAAEVKAVASDNPLIMEQVALEKEISKLQSLQQAHRASVSRAEEKIVIDRRNIANLENLISNLQADLQSRKDTYSSDKVFSIQIGNQTFTDKKDAGAALVAAAEAKAKEGEYTDIGKFAGFTLRVVKTNEGVKGQVSGAGSYEFKTYPLNPTFGINHLIAVVESFEEKHAYWNKNLSEAKSDLETQKQLAAEPFDQVEKLKQKRARYNEVMYILNPPADQHVSDEDVQEQSRAYLNGRASYVNISQQEWRQIQEDRMTKYGGRFDEMPVIDFTHAHDILYVFENFDETHFGVLERVDPARNKTKADIIVEVFDDGPVRDIQDYRGRFTRMRNFQKMRSMYHSSARNRGAGAGNVGLDTGAGASSDGVGMPGTGSSDQSDLNEQHQSRAYLEGDREPAPVFYSQMAKVIDGVKLGKLEAASVVNLLRGKGVKAEEIKWSGIETFLEGKKSVTKAELQEFIAGSMLQIEEQTSGTATFIADDGNTYTSEAAFKDAAFAIAESRGIDRSRVRFVIDTEYDMDAYAYVGAWNNTILTAEVSEAEGTSPRFTHYKLDGGTNYREFVFQLPDNSYSNQAMRVHWGDDAGGILAHARIQDFDVDGKKMLFIEEIQSDYHNEGHQSGYADSKLETEIDRLKAIADERFLAMEDYSVELTGLAGEREAMERTVEGSRLLLEYLDAQNAYDAAMNEYVKKIPDAPFRDTYHEYVLKRLIREAAEKGYDSIGWTTAQTQSERWSEEYAEGYRIEYDQDIPKFLSKYGKKWGAKVSKSQIGDDTIWVMNITDSMRDSVIYQGQAQFQQRTDTLTDREVLAMAASQVKVDDLTAAEKDALDIFQKRLSKLEALQTERAEQGRLYKEQQFGAKVDRAKAAETLNRMHTLDDQIQKASADVLSVEEKTVLKRVLQKARGVVEQQERQHGQEILKRWRDRRNNADAIKKYRDRIRGDVDELTNWVLHPDNKSVVKHIPDALKNTVIPFLSSINFMSKRSLKGGNATAGDKAFMDQLRRLAKVMENAVEVDEMYSNYNDLPPDFMKNLRSFMDTAQQIVDNSNGEYIINQMTSEELQKLSKVVRTLKKYIMTMNRFHVNAMFKHVYDAGDNSIHFLSLLKPAENTGAVSQFLLWQQMRPAYAFERFGDGGVAIYDGLRRGQATLAFNTKKIMEFSEKAYTTAEVKAWDNQVKTIRLGDGRTIKMRVSQIMSLYELSKREQAQGHIFGEGIRVATFKAGNKKISDVGQTITPEELNTILQTLTPRQKDVADKLQQFMQKQGGEWGNYVTVARFGEKQFGEENYFPINSDGRHLQVDADEKPGAAALYALLNMGFTKQTQEKAKNRLIVYSIFDVFANHMASMAQYNAFALPVIDALKWFNYQQIVVEEDGSKTIQGSVREQMDRAFGVPEENRPGSGRRGYAQNFVINIIKAFNGTEAQGTPYDSFGMNTLHHYNRAQVAYNLRVVVQQPLAITRAAQLLDYGSIIKGMKLQPAAIQKNIREMQRYSGIAAWKSLGFYDVNISRGLTSIIKHDDTVMDKITDVGMWGAEKADTLTWAAMWSACKEEVIRKQKLTPKSEGFYEAVTKLFEDVIYKTQVVDSVLTKNEFMRDKGFFARAVGSFMSEPTTTASMLVDAYDKYHMDLQRGMTKQQAWKKNGKMIVRTAYVYAVGAAILAAVQAVADAFRDDDDYQEWYEKWLEAFGGNLVDELMPFNKLPILSDVYELAKELLSVFGVDTYGNPPQSVFMQWYDSLAKGVEIIYGKITGEEDRYTWYGGAYKLLQAVSGMTGLPMAGATREIVTAWNNTVGAMAPSLKVKTYDPGEMNEIKYAYQDGYLTNEEAAEQLLQKGLVDTENEAYFTIQGWEAGDGYSRYDAIYDAVRNGGDFNAAMRELTSHGYKERDVLSQVKSEIGAWYTDGEITKQQAINMLTKYFDMDSDEITATVNKWSSKVVTGIAFDDIKDEFLEGNITEARAIDMYVRYGGYTKEKATETVTEWRAEKETGIAYDDIKDAFMDGEISEGDVRNMFITYGGYTEQEAGEKAAVLAFVKQHPKCDGISYAAVESYQTNCEADGVPAETFYDAWKYNSNTHADVDANGESISGSKKAKVLTYIDSLDLSYSQKDSLYYAFGWAASRIYEAPWH